MFIDDQGNYNKALVNDMQGLLILYEAGQFRVLDEEILDEAVNFTTTHLKLMLPKLSNSLSIQVNNALKYPINKTIARNTYRFIKKINHVIKCYLILPNWTSIHCRRCIKGSYVISQGGTSTLQKS
ncbi:hypothetical protein RDI58_018397 [Solanum bulbocastanum]|uniref:Terpene synthase N-terminal domain-containing protein n=1 Tax=Solanum bulbocastanum TaxID=147425 RepID=A0AAN8TH82_SOLBU